MENTNWAATDFDFGPNLDWLYEPLPDIEVPDAFITNVDEDITIHDHVSVITEVDLLHNDVGTFAKTTNTSKSRRWLITVNNYRLEGKPQLTKEFVFGRGGNYKVVSMSSQYEIGTEGTPHLHIYVNFSDAIPFRRLVKYIETIFGTHPNIKQVGRLKRDAVRAFNYCVKSDTRDCDESTTYAFNAPSVGTSITGSISSSGSTRGSKTSLNTAKELLIYKLFYETHLGKSFDEIKAIEAAAGNRENLVLLASVAKSYIARYLEHLTCVVPIPNIKNVIILYGQAGTGKTTWLSNNFKRYDSELSDDYHKHCYTQSRNLGSWTTYANEQLFFFDEFVGTHFPLENILQMTDVGKRPPSLNKKGSHAQSRYHTIVFTSNVHPMLWYKNVYSDEPFRWTAFARRVTECYYLPAIKTTGESNTYHDNKENPEFVAEFIKEDLLSLKADAPTMLECAVKSGKDQAMGYASGFWDQATMG